MNIFLIEDDIELLTSIETFLSIKNHNVTTCYDGANALNKLDEISSEYDLFIIDVNIPNINGIELLKHIRKTKIDIPIIIVTASLEVETLQDAFTYGCTEYIKKPFNLIELELRIKKIFNDSITAIDITKDFNYEPQTMDLKYQGNSIELRKKERLIIDILCKNIGYIVPISNIIDYVWQNEEKENYPLRQTLSTIRQKLPYDIIKTEIGTGYKIDKNI